MSKKLNEESQNRLTVRVTMPRIQQRPNSPLDAKVRISSGRRLNPMINDVLGCPRPCPVMTL
jgi:hypothetical protein